MSIIVNPVPNGLKTIIRKLVLQSQIQRQVLKLKRGQKKIIKQLILTVMIIVRKRICDVHLLISTPSHTAASKKLVDRLSQQELHPPQQVLHRLNQVRLSLPTKPALLQLVQRSQAPQRRIPNQLGKEKKSQIVSSHVKHQAKNAHE